MRITHIAAPAGFGGLERVIVLLSGGMSARGHEVNVVAVVSRDAEADPFTESLRKHQIPVQTVRVGTRQYLRERSRVHALLAALPPDVVHTHGYRADVIHAGAATAIHAGSVSTLHGFTGGGVRNIVYEWLQVRALRRFDMVVAVSAPILERLMAAGVSPEKVRLIRNGIPREPSLLERDAARQALGIDPDAVTVGWVGRMSAEKGPDVMLSAAARLSQENVSVSFIGDGPELGGMREQIATGGLTQHVRLHGSVPDAGRLLAAFDVIVLSSRTEGTPVVLLEAVAAGVPVVATRVGGIPDIVSTHEVLLVSPDSPEEIVAAVLRLKHDAALRSALAQAAYARVSRELGYEQWITSYEDVYRSVAPASGAAP